MIEYRFSLINGKLFSFCLWVILHTSTLAQWKGFDLSIQGGLLYGYTGDNVNYSVKKFNSYNARSNPEYWKGAESLPDELYKLKYYEGITEVRDYVSARMDFQLRRILFWDRMDLGLRMGYFFKRRDYDYYILDPIFLTWPGSLLHFPTTSEYLHYLNLGVQLGFRLPRYKSWLRFSLERSINFNRNVDFVMAYDLYGRMDFRVRHIRKSGWDRSLPLTVELTRTVSQNWSVGVNARFLMSRTSDESVTEEFELIDTFDQEVLQRGLYRMKDIFVGIHASYRIWGN
jgi:hypothetical protein